MKLLLGFSRIERALSKRGVVYGTSFFRTESVKGKQREGFYVVNYSDEPCLEMVTFLYVPSVLVFMEWEVGERGGRSEHVTRVVYETVEQWKLLNSLLIFIFFF